MMGTQEILAIIIILTAIFAYINYRWIKWPTTIGIMALSLMLSVLLAVFGKSKGILTLKALELTTSVDFHDLLMNFMLSFLLFAGSIHIDATKLRKEFWPVVLLSVVGTTLSTFLIGGMMWYLFSLFHLQVPLIYCLLFGALISPTDPVAVLGILKEAKIPSSLELKISGESLFNDGVGVVIFMTIAEAAKTGGAEFSFLNAVKLFIQEAFGGLLFGGLLGYIGFWIVRTVDDYKVETLISLAIVTGGYFIAGYLHVSGPLAVIVAGIISGNKVRKEAMSDVSRDYLGKFWELIDEILNAILFLLIGLEMLVIKPDRTIMLIGLIAIAVVLVARWLSVIFPVLLLKYKIKFEKHAVAILTWGGLRGGISVALALSLSKDMYRDQFVLITYIIVVFSILVQGLTIGKVAKKLQGA